MTTRFISGALPPAAASSMTSFLSNDLSSLAGLSQKIKNNEEATWLNRSCMKSNSPELKL